MALDFTKFVRLLVIANLATLIAPTLSKAQVDPTDPRGLYESYGPLERPASVPKENEFRRRIPESTKSRFAPHFRGYMGETGTEGFGDTLSGVKGRGGLRSSYDFADGLENENEKGFQSARVSSRFGDKERDTRRDAYREYLKERDPAKRAQLYREYLGKNSNSQSTEDRSLRRDTTNSSQAPSMIEPPGFGMNRVGSIGNRAASSSTSSSLPAPRASLFSSSSRGAKTQTPAGLFRRSDEPATQKSTGSPSRRPSPRSSETGGQGFESDRDR